MGDAILSIGLDPSVVDFSAYPDLNEETLRARIAAGEAALREAGFDFETCLLTLDPDEVEKKVREHVAARPVQVVMIGAGLRMAAEHTPLFERVLNLVNELAPGVVFCFNTSPESTIDALRRWARPSG